MNDRELLEWAAKAAEISIDYSHEGRGFDVLGNAVLDWHNGTKWNPLDDDGDALRLAVKLGISISFSHSTSLDVPYPTINEVGAFAGWSPTYSEANSSDWAAATRRAIVRAAAEIGKGMA